MLDELYEKWKAGNAMETNFIQDYTDLDKFMEKLYDEMKISVDRDLKPYDAYFKILKLNNFVNSIMAKRPDIVDSIGHWFQKEKRIWMRLQKRSGLFTWISG
jgi:hypothetical protein